MSHSITIYPREKWRQKDSQRALRAALLERIPEGARTSSNGRPTHGGWTAYQIVSCSNVSVMVYIRRFRPIYHCIGYLDYPFEIQQE